MNRLDLDDDSLAIRSRDSRARYFASVVLPMLVAATAMIGSVLGAWLSIDRRLTGIEISMQNQSQRARDFRERDWSTLIRRIESSETAIIAASMRLTKIETEMAILNSRAPLPAAARR